MSPWSHYVSYSALPGEGVGSRKGADTELISLALRRGTEKGARNVTLRTREKIIWSELKGRKNVCLMTGGEKLKCFLTTLQKKILA